MKYRKFSNLNWNVSEIGLGCWGIGGNWDDVKDDEAMSVLKRSLEKELIFLILLMFTETEEVKNL